MEFATAGITVAVWVPPLAGFLVSFFTSMGGLSGAFLLLPFQMSVLGYTTPSVSGTNQFYNIVAIPSGVYRYVREGRMLWPLTTAVVLGTMPGVLFGAIIRVTLLPDPRLFKLFAATVLGYVGVRMLHDLRSGPKTPPSLKERGRVVVLERSLRRLAFTFEGQTYACSTLTVSILCFLVGIIGGIYGIGGGAIVAPFFVSMLGLPVYTIAGATLMGTFVTSIVGVFFYQLLAYFYPQASVAPDWSLGLLFGLGGMVGMYCGARLQKHIPAWMIKTMLCVVILGTAGKYALGFFHV